MKSLFIAFFISASLSGFGQKPSPSAEKARNVYFYKKGLIEVASKDSADITQIITEPDAGEKLYDVQEFDKDGHILMWGKSVDVHPVKLQGQAIYYYPDRSKKLLVSYVSGRPDGDRYEYYPNGKVHVIMNFTMRDSMVTRFKISYRDSSYKFLYDTAGKALVDNGNGYFKRPIEDGNDIAEEGQVVDSKRVGEWKGYDSKEKLSFIEKYVNGKLVEGVSTDSAGNSYSYKIRTKLAGYPGNGDSFGKLLAQNIRYPAYSRENNHQGRVIICFRISKNGQADNFRVLQSVDQYADAEALRIIKLNTIWSPGEYYGKKESMYFAVPISFTLQRQ